MRPDVVLKAGTLAGKILLESGAETVRVEETVTRICESFLAHDAQAFATPTGLFVSFDYNDDSYTKVLRIKGSRINLERINQVNQISRQCASSELDETQAFHELKKVTQIQEYPTIMRILSGGFAAMFFTYLFEGILTDGFYALVIGTFVQYVGGIFDRKNINSIVKITILSAMLTFLILILTYIGLVHSRDTTIIGTLMLLVPGVAITNAVRDWISGDLLSGATRAIEAVLIAVALALGAGIVLSVWMMYIGGV